MAQASGWAEDAQCDPGDAAVRAPVGASAYTRLFPGLRSGATPRRKLSGSATDWLGVSAYSSSLPRTRSGGPLPPLSDPTAGESRSCVPIFTADPTVNRTMFVVGSTDCTFDGSTTGTGQPGTSPPVGVKAYTWRSSDDTTMSSCELPCRWARVGAARMPGRTRLLGSRMKLPPAGAPVQPYSESAP